MTNLNFWVFLRDFRRERCGGLMVLPDVANTTQVCVKAYSHSYASL